MALHPPDARKVEDAVRQLAEKPTPGVRPVDGFVFSLVVARQLRQLASLEHDCGAVGVQDASLPSTLSGRIAAVDTRTPWARDLTEEIGELDRGGARVEVRSPGYWHSSTPASRCLLYSLLAVHVEQMLDAARRTHVGVLLAAALCHPTTVMVHGALGNFLTDTFVRAKIKPVSLHSHFVKLMQVPGPDSELHLYYLRAGPSGSLGAQSSLDSVESRGNVLDVLTRERVACMRLIRLHVRSTRFAVGAWMHRVLEELSAILEELVAAGETPPLRYLKVNVVITDEPSAPTEDQEQLDGSVRQRMASAIMRLCAVALRLPALALLALPCRLMTNECLPALESLVRELPSLQVIDLLDAHDLSESGLATVLDAARARKRPLASVCGAAPGTVCAHIRLTWPGDISLAAFDVSARCGGSLRRVDVRMVRGRGLELAAERLVSQLVQAALDMTGAQCRASQGNADVTGAATSPRLEALYLDLLGERLTPELAHVTALGLHARAPDLRFVLSGRTFVKGDTGALSVTPHAVMPQGRLVLLLHHLASTIEGGQQGALRRLSLAGVRWAPEITMALARLIECSGVAALNLIGVRCPLEDIMRLQAACAVSSNPPNTLSGAWVEFPKANVEVNGATDVDAALLAYDQARHPSPPSTLILRNNLITDEGARELAACLHANTRLEHIDLTLSSVGEAGCLHFARALEANATLKSLKLRLGIVSHAGARALLRAAAAHAALELLDIAQNDLDAEQLEPLVRAATGARTDNHGQPSGGASGDVDVAAAGAASSSTASSSGGPRRASSASASSKASLDVQYQ